MIAVEDFMHARYYSSDLGRFLSVDPVGGTVGSSQSWNRYGYALNNPVAAVDPDGRFALVLFAAPAIKAGWVAAAAAATAGIAWANAVPEGEYRTNGRILMDAVADKFNGLTEQILVQPLPGVHSDGVQIDPGQMIAPEQILPAPDAGGTPGQVAQPSPVTTSTETPVVQSPTTTNLQRSSAGKNDPHGDSGRAQTKADSQLDALKERLQSATGREAKRIKQTIENIKKSAAKARKGETHHRR